MRTVLQMLKWFALSRTLSFEDPMWIERLLLYSGMNAMKPEQNGRHFEDDIFKCILLSKNCGILNKISVKFVVTKGSVNN